MNHFTRMKLHVDEPTAWSVSVNGSTVTREWGRVGDEAETAEDNFNSPKAAENAAWDWACEKAREGYRVVEGPQQFRQLNIAIPVPRKWEQELMSDAFKQLSRSEKLREALANIKISDTIRALLQKLDVILETQGVLIVESPVDAATALFLFTHENAHLVKEIRHSCWDDMDISWLRKHYSDNLERFAELYPVEIPVQFLEHQLFHECTETVLGRGISSSTYDDICERNGVFGNLFETGGPHENDIIRHRYLHDPCNYFPTWPTDWYQCNYGFVFDQVERCLSPAICSAYKSEYANTSEIWSDFLAQLSGASDDFYTIEDLEECVDKFTENSIVGLKRLEKKLDNSSYWDICGVVSLWLVSATTLGFLNSKCIPDIEFREEAKRRYGVYHSRAQESALRCNEEEIFPYPYFEFDDRFNPALGKRFVEALLIWLSDEPFETDYFDYERPAEEVMLTDYPAEMELLGFKAEDLAPKTNLENNKLVQLVEAFCMKEIEEERPLLPYLVAIHAWNDCLTVDRKAKTKMATNIMQNLPDDVCDPLIKLVAKEHAPVRFDEKILT